MTTDLVTTNDPVPRDNFKRPLVTPPGGGKRVPYTRCTTYVGCLEDTFNLTKWEKRMVALGLADRPDLQLAVTAHRSDKDKLNEICEEAKQFAKASAAATTGTALHALTEQYDRGLELGAIPDAYRADIDAYIDATADLTHTAIERFTVVDELKVGGTPDRISTYKYDRKHRVADIKTGSIDYGIGKIAMQLAMYAHGRFYDHATGERSNMPLVDLDHAVIIHLPAGQGRCELVTVDIAAGWRAVVLAGQVRKWRARKDLIGPWPPTKAGHTRTPSLPDLINDAATVDELVTIWQDNQAHWTEAHTELAAKRKRQLQGGTGAA